MRLAKATDRKVTFLLTKPAGINTTRYEQPPYTIRDHFSTSLTYTPFHISQSQVNSTPCKHYTYPTSIPTQTNHISKHREHSILSHSEYYKLLLQQQQAEASPRYTTEQSQLFALSTSSVSNASLSTNGISDTIIPLPIIDVSFNHASSNEKFIFKALLDTGAIDANYSTYYAYSCLQSYGCILEALPIHVIITLADKTSTCSATIKCLCSITIQVNNVSTSTQLWLHVINDTDCNDTHNIIIGWPTLTTSLITPFVTLLLEAKNQSVNTETSPLLTHLSSLLQESPTLWQADPTLFESLIPDSHETAPEELADITNQINYIGESYEQALLDYQAAVTKQVNPQLLANPKFKNFIENVFVECCVKLEWTGIQGIEPIKMRFTDNMPSTFNNVTIPVPFKMRHTFNKATAQYFKYQYTEVSDTGWAHPCFLTPKPGGGWRLVINYNGSKRDGSSGANAYIQSPSQLRTKAIEALIAFMHTHWLWLGDLDLMRAFHQLPLHPDTAVRLGVLFPDGVRIPKYLPEGCTPATAYLTIAMRELLGDFIKEGWLLVLFDNFLVGGISEDDFLTKLIRVHHKATQHGMIFNFNKCHFDNKVDSFFGLQVKANGKYTLSKTRTQAIRDLPMPNSRKDMMSVLGVLNFAGTFVPNFSKMAANLYKTTSVTWDWSKELDPQLQLELHILINAAANSIDLTFPDFSLPFIVRTDASDQATAGFLLQVRQVPVDLITADSNRPTEIIKYIKEAVPTSSVDNYNITTSTLEALKPREGFQNQYEVIAVCGTKLSEVACRAWTPQHKEMFAVKDACEKFAPFLLGGPFIIDTDNNNNTNWRSSSDPKICHWAETINAKYDAVRRRCIPRAHNYPADTLTQLAKLATIRQVPDTAAILAELAGIPPAITELFHKVHGTRKGHWGSKETALRMQAENNTVAFTDRHVQVMRMTCPTCQKFCNKKPPLDTLYRSLKTPSILARIGIDLAQFRATPTGYSYFYVIVDHFDHHVWLEATTEKTALSLARTLFRYFTIFGTPTEIISDAGSDLMARCIQYLVELFGIHQIFALIDRHESSMAEPQVREVLRHLKHLVYDTTSREHWHQNEFLQAVAATLNNHINRTTGFSANQLRFGMGLRGHFNIEKRNQSTDRTTYAGQVDAMLNALRESSSAYQQIAIDRKTAAASTNHEFFEGDLVFHYVPTVSKPGSRYQGPYKVLHQRNNEIAVLDLVTGAKRSMHISRLQLFLGTIEEATNLARWDNDQQIIMALLDYRGDPSHRLAMDFLLEYADGQKLWHRYAPDITTTQQYHTFITTTQPELRILTLPVALIDEAKREENRKGFPQSVGINQEVYINLRAWGDSNWYQQLHLPEGNYLTVGLITKIHCKSIAAKKSTTAKKYGAVKSAVPAYRLYHADVFFAITKETFMVDPFELKFKYQFSINPTDILVDAALVEAHPAIKPTGK